MSSDHRVYPMVCDRPVIIGRFCASRGLRSKSENRCLMESWCLEPYGGEAERHSNSLCTQRRGPCAVRTPLSLSVSHSKGKV